jgi:hypothetical protein
MMHFSSSCLALCGKVHYMVAADAVSTWNKLAICLCIHICCCMVHTLSLTTGSVAHPLPAGARASGSATAKVGSAGSVRNPAAVDSSPVLPLAATGPLSGYEQVLGPVSAAQPRNSCWHTGNSHCGCGTQNCRSVTLSPALHHVMQLYATDLPPTLPLLLLRLLRLSMLCTPGIIIGGSAPMYTPLPCVRAAEASLFLCCSMSPRRHHLKGF